MPKNRDRPFSILDLVKQLITDAIDWSNDEMALTRLDAKSMLRRVLIGLGFVFVSFAILIAAVFTLAQTLIGALAAYLNGHTIAGLVVSLFLFGITLLLMAAARYFLTHKPRIRGVIFRRIVGEKIE